MSKTHECVLCTKQVFVKFLPEKPNWVLNLLFFFFPLLGRNKLQIGTAEREREQNKDITESCGRITESRSRKKGLMFFSGKFDFSAGLRDGFGFVWRWVKFRHNIGMIEICFPTDVRKNFFYKA